MTTTNNNNPHYIYERCNRCGSYVDTSHSFCPNCGAKMERNHREPSAETNFSEQFNMNDAFAASPAGCSRGVAALLAIFLGSLGIHYFYIGKTTAGLIMLLATVLSCGILAVITNTLSLAQGIYMFIINNRDFYDKYVATPDSFPLF